MANAVSNATGNVYFSKISGTTNLFFADPASGVPTYTGAANVTASTILAPSLEKGPAKSSIVDRLTIAAGFTTGNICYKAISSLDMSSKEAITLYIRSSVALASGVLQFVLDDTAACASPIETLNIPALTANEWQRVLLKLNDPSSNTAIISLGLQAASDPGACVVDVYQPRYMDEFEGRTAFTITQNVDSLDATDYQSVGSREFKAGLSAWTASLEGHKESSPPLEKTAEYVFGFVEADTAGSAFVGNGFFTSFNPSGNFAALVMYSYTIQGTGYLHSPTV